VRDAARKEASPAAVERRTLAFIGEGPTRLISRLEVHPSEGTWKDILGG